MSIGMNTSKTPKQWNLTELRRKSRKGKENKSGRKRPRPGDHDVAPAPDAPGSVPAVTSEEEKGGGTVTILFLRGWAIPVRNGTKY